VIGPTISMEGMIVAEVLMSSSGTVVVIVPFFTLLLFEALTLLMPVFDPTVCISAVDGITQISVIPVSSLATFLLWSETAYRVPK
jgi:hypothetical protein